MNAHSFVGFFKKKIKKLMSNVYALCVTTLTVNLDHHFLKSLTNCGARSDHVPLADQLIVPEEEGEKRWKATETRLKNVYT